MGHEPILVVELYIREFNAPHDISYYKNISFCGYNIFNITLPEYTGSERWKNFKDIFFAVSALSFCC